MNQIEAIRKSLGLSQAALADGIGCTQGNIGHYERGQAIPPDRASRLIAFAATKGLALTFDHVYGDNQVPSTPTPATQGA